MRSNNVEFKGDGANVVVRVGCPAGMAAIGQSRPEDEFEGRSAYQSAANALTIICGRPS
jgi:hypothetical protein